MFCLQGRKNAKMQSFLPVMLGLFFIISSSWARYLGLEDNEIGPYKSCSNEGGDVEMELVAQNPCFHCICRNGRVECDYRACPSLKGCHAILFMRSPGSCCDKCKGCIVNGTILDHGEAWTDFQDPCKVMMCQAGVLTTSREMCKPPCSNPAHIPGQCCPTCAGCFFEGKTYTNGESFTSTSDKKLECSCMGGNITCSQRVCPVLNCPEDNLLKSPGEKCPQCKGQRRVYTLRESCYFARKVYDNGDVTVLDSCTSCVCQEGTMLCERQQCPEAKCPPSERVITQGECCPRCRKKPSCKSSGQVYQHGEKWRERRCSDCQCDHGRKWCQPATCSKLENCPLGFKKVRKQGDCCEKCIKDEKTCSVSGPRVNHFKTLDGRHFNISKPSCKYTLVKDCYQDQVDVKIRYKQKQEETYPSISHISIILGSNSIKLSRNFKIKVNRTHLISRRYSKPGTLNIRVNFPVVIVQDKTKGIRVIWNMNSGVKVKVDRRYRKSGRLCGLCGNYNSHKSDDFINPKGQLLKTPNQMAVAWSLKKSCHSASRTQIIPLLSNNQEVLEIDNVLNADISGTKNDTADVLSTT